MDIGRAFKYAFEDEQWTGKLGLGLLIHMVPILSFAITGFTVQIERRVAQGDPRPMPTWSDLGALFMDGLWLTLAFLVYGLPILLILMVGMVVFFALVLVAAAAGTPEIGILLGFAVGFIAVIANWAYSFVLGFFIPAITIQYARVGTFGSCFAFSEMLALIRGNFSAYLTAWGVRFGGRMVIGLVLPPISIFLSLIPLIGSILTMALFVSAYLYLAVVLAHVYGELMAMEPEGEELAA